MIGFAVTEVQFYYTDLDTERPEVWIDLYSSRPLHLQDSDYESGCKVVGLKEL